MIPTVTRTRNTDEKEKLKFNLKQKDHMSVAGSVERAGARLVVGEEETRRL